MRFLPVSLTEKPANRTFIYNVVPDVRFFKPCFPKKKKKGLFRRKKARFSCDSGYELLDLSTASP